MNTLDISDLSFYEVITEEDIKVNGGLLFRLLPDYFLPFINLLNNKDDYNKTPIFSDKTTVVNQLENPKNGTSGYEVSIDDGQYKSSLIVLSGVNPTAQILTSVKSYSSASAIK